jgi:hypothetical protein
MTITFLAYLLLPKMIGVPDSETSVNYQISYVCWLRRFGSFSLLLNPECGGSVTSKRRLVRILSQINLIHTNLSSLSKIDFREENYV